MLKIGNIRINKNTIVTTVKPVNAKAYLNFFLFETK